MRDRRYIGSLAGILGADQSIARRMLDRRIGCLPVLEGPRLVGILTEGDFVRRAML